MINKIGGVQPRYFHTAAKDYFPGVTFNANDHYIVKKKKRVDAWASDCSSVKLSTTISLTDGTFFLVVFSNKQWYFNYKFSAGFLSVD